MNVTSRISRGLAGLLIGAGALNGIYQAPNQYDSVYASTNAPYKVKDSVPEQRFYSVNSNKRYAYDLKYVDLPSLIIETPEYKQIKERKLKKGEDAQYDLLVARASKRVSDAILKKMEDDGIGIVLLGKEYLQHVEGLDINLDDYETVNTFNYSPKIIESLKKEKVAKKTNYFDSLKMVN